MAKLSTPASERAWFEAIRFSRRSSIHFTGAAPNLNAAAMIAASSRITIIFWPKPPPTSSATARMCDSGRPVRRPANDLISCTDWVAARMYISPR